jgi:hypothetical protein
MTSEKFEKYLVIFFMRFYTACVGSDGSKKLEADVQAGQAEHLFRRWPQSAKGPRTGTSKYVG